MMMHSRGELIIILAASDASCLEQRRGLLAKEEDGLEVDVSCGHTLCRGWTCEHASEAVFATRCS